MLVTRGNVCLWLSGVHRTPDLCLTLLVVGCFSWEKNYNGPQRRKVIKHDSCSTESFRFQKSHKKANPKHQEHKPNGSSSRGGCLNYSDAWDCDGASSFQNGVCLNEQTAFWLILANLVKMSFSILLFMNVNLSTSLPARYFLPSVI